MNVNKNMEHDDNLSASDSYWREIFSLRETRKFEKRQL